MYFTFFSSITRQYICVLSILDGADGALSPQQSCRPPPVAPPPWMGPVVCSQPLRSLSPPDGLENPAEERPNVRRLLLF